MLFEEKDVFWGWIVVKGKTEEKTFFGKKVGSGK